MLTFRFLVCTAFLAAICLTVVAADRARAGDRQASPDVVAPEFVALPSGGSAKPAK